MGVRCVSSIVCVISLSTVPVVCLGDDGERPARSTPAASKPTGRTASPAAYFPKIDRRPEPMVWRFEGALRVFVSLASVMRKETGCVDLRSFDLSRANLRDKPDTLRRASFDERTKWPPASALPEGFDPAKIMALGKNPGLGVRRLHQQGITGRGVGVAIIDQTLLVDHQEYGDRLRLYEETDDIVKGWRNVQMHGPAVASLAVGKTVGVAPEADLYYIATARGGDGKDFGYLARSIRRILAVNERLPADRKVRTIAMQIGWGPKVKGYKELMAATAQAKAVGMLVVCSSIEEVHGFKFHGLGRDSLADPDRFESYRPGCWWAERFHGANARAKRFYAGRLLIPMDCRTTACPQSRTGYVFYWEGGWSWSIPYIAGLYALAVQTDPAITPERFWKLALGTGQTIRLKSGNKQVPFGPIVNPPRLINAIRDKAQP